MVLPRLPEMTALDYGGVPLRLLFECPWAPRPLPPLWPLPGDLLGLGLRRPRKGSTDSGRPSSGGCGEGQSVSRIFEVLGNTGFLLGRDQRGWGPSSSDVCLPTGEESEARDLRALQRVGA